MWDSEKILYKNYVNTKYSIYQVAKKFQALTMH